MVRTRREEGALIQALGSRVNGSRVEELTKC